MSAEVISVDDELDGLEAVLMEDFRRLDAGETEGVVGGFEALILPVDDLDSSHCNVTLKVQIPTQYPKVTPIVSIEQVDGISEKTGKNLLNKINKDMKAIHKNGNTQMLYTIVDITKEFLKDYNFIGADEDDWVDDTPKGLDATSNENENEDDDEFGFGDDDDAEWGDDNEEDLGDWGDTQLTNEDPSISKMQDFSNRNDLIKLYDSDEEDKNKNQKKEHNSQFEMPKLKKKKETPKQLLNKIKRKSLDLNEIILNNKDSNSSEFLLAANMLELVYNYNNKVHNNKKDFGNGIDENRPNAKATVDGNGIFVDCRVLDVTDINSMHILCRELKYDHNEINGLYYEVSIGVQLQHFLKSKALATVLGFFENEYVVIRMWFSKNYLSDARPPKIVAIGKTEPWKENKQLKLQQLQKQQQQKQNKQNNKNQNQNKNKNKNKNNNNNSNNQNNRNTKGNNNNNNNNQHNHNTKGNNQQQGKKKNKNKNKNKNTNQNNNNNKNSKNNKKKNNNGEAEGQVCKKKNKKKNLDEDDDRLKLHRKLRSFIGCQSLMNRVCNKFFARFWPPNRRILKARPKYYCQILRLMAITHYSYNICHNAMNYFNNFEKSLLYLTNVDSNINNSNSNSNINTTDKGNDINGDSDNDDDSDGIVDTNDVIAAPHGTDDLEQNCEMDMETEMEMKLELEMEGVTPNANKNDKNDEIDSKKNNTKEAYEIIFGSKSRVDKFGTTWKQVLDLCDEFVKYGQSEHMIKMTSHKKKDYSKKNNKNRNKDNQENPEAKEKAVNDIGDNGDNDEEDGKAIELKTDEIETEKESIVDIIDVNKQMQISEKESLFCQTEMYLYLNSDQHKLTKIESFLFNTCNFFQCNILMQILFFSLHSNLTLSQRCLVCDNEFAITSLASQNDESKDKFDNSEELQATNVKYMIKPTVCNNYLCLFTFEELQVGFDITSYLIHSSSIVDLLITFCYVACKKRHNNYYTSKRLSNAIKLFFPYNVSAFNKKTNKLESFVANRKASGLKKIEKFETDKRHSKMTADEIALEKQVKKENKAEKRHQLRQETDKLSRANPAAFYSRQNGGYSFGDGRVARQMGLFADPYYGNALILALSDYRSPVGILNDANYTYWNAQYRDWHYHRSTYYSSEYYDYNKLEKVINQMPSIDTLLLWCKKGGDRNLEARLNSRSMLLFPLLKWIITTNRSYIYELRGPHKFRDIPSSFQFKFMTSSPERERQFQLLVKEAEKFRGKGEGVKWAWHGSPLPNWHAIVRNGLKNMSNTKYRANGAAFGSGVYLAPDSGTSYWYCDASNTDTWALSMLNRDRHAKGHGLYCLALCQIVNHEKLKPPEPYYVVPTETWIITRYLFVFNTSSNKSKRRQGIGGKGTYFDINAQTLISNYRKRLKKEGLQEL